MNHTLAPIETKYRGCRFRSRLEARWAVFFDALGVKWEYEPESYRTPGGGYIPDFLLHARAFVEVKPEIRLREDSGVTDWARWGGVVRQSGMPLLAVFGMPDEKAQALLFEPYVWDDAPDPDPRYPYHAHVLLNRRIAVCENCHALGWFDDESGMDFFCLGGCEHWHWFSREFYAAADAARGARFEFGESGSPRIGGAR